MDQIQQQRKSKKQMSLTIGSSLFGDFGSNIFSFGLSFMLLEKTGSIYSFALSSILSPIIGLILLPVIGPIVDKYSRKKIILLSQTLTIIGLVGYWFLFENIQDHLLAYSLGLIIVLRTSDQFTSTARQASNVQLVLSEELQKLSAYTQMATSVSGVVSSILGALLYGLLPFYLFILFELVTELIPIGITLILDFNFVSAGPAIGNFEKGNFQLFKEGLRYLSKQKYVIMVLFLALIVNFFSGIFSVGLPVLVLQVFKMSNVTYGIIEAMNGLGFVFGGFLIQKRSEYKYPVHHVWRMSLMIGALLICIGLLPVVGLSRIITIALLSVFLFLIGMLYVSLNVPYTVWLQKQLPADMQGRVFSVLSMLGVGIAPIGVFLFGLLFGTTGIPLSLLTAVIFIGAGILISGLNFFIVKASGLHLKKAVIYSLASNSKTVK